MIKHLLVALIFITTPLFANQSMEEVKNFIYEKVDKAAKARYPNQEVIVNVGNIDTRIKLSNCLKSDLKIHNPYKKPLGKTGSIAVMCQKPHQWTLYIPVTVNVFKEVVVASHGIAKGQQLNPDNVRLQRENISNLKGQYFTNINEVNDLATKRSLRGNEIITLSKVKPQIVIHRGDEIILRAEMGPVSVEIKGEALENGARGQKIAIKNLKSKKIVEGQVIHKGLVKINL